MCRCNINDVDGDPVPVNPFEMHIEAKVELLWMAERILSSPGEQY